MVILNMLKVKRYIYTVLFTLIFLTLPASKSLASEPSFSFYPDGGVVTNKDEGFTVDVLIDSAGEEVTSARFTVLFDPAVLELEKAERNNSLFELFPEDESSLDNENGVVMLTGFTQSGSSALYSTNGDPDVLARLTFNVLKEGDTLLEWKFTGGTDLFDTYILKEGSPPQSILLTKPNSAKFSIGEILVQSGDLANTGMSLDKYIIVTGVVLVLFGALLVFSNPKSRGRGTVVIYEG